MTAPARKPTPWTRTTAGTVSHEIWVARTLLRFTPDADASARGVYTRLMQSVPPDESEVMHAFTLAMWRQLDLMQRLRTALGEISTHGRAFRSAEQLLRFVLGTPSLETNEQESKP